MDNMTPEEIESMIVRLQVREPCTTICLRTASYLPPACLPASFLLQMQKT
jgi:hypothetical protein